MGKETRGCGKRRRAEGSTLLSSPIARRPSCKWVGTESPSAAGEKGIFAVENKVLLVFASTASKTTRSVREYCANHTGRKASGDGSPMMFEISVSFINEKEKRASMNPLLNRVLFKYKAQ